MTRRRAAFLSDVHLGSTHCHAEELAVFLGTLDVERLYLVGDIIDLWWLSARRAAWGHIHRPALIERDGLVYANDGDWVESLTALVEDRDGTLRLLDHRGETLQRLGPRVCGMNERRRALLPASPLVEPLHAAA